MRMAIWVMVLILLIIHQDFWNWNDGTLVFGFMPMGLFYHACISLAAGCVWFMACQFAWPEDETESDDASRPDGEGSQS